MSEGDLQRELAYYRRNLDLIAGENLRLDSALRALRHELAQKRQGLALLSELHQSISAQTPTPAVLGIAVAAINASMGMDRTLFLAPTADPTAFRPSHWAGFVAEDDFPPLGDLTVEVPPEVAKGLDVLLVTSRSEPSPLEQALVAAFGLPQLVCVPIPGDGGPLGLLLCGRRHENAVVSPALDKGDVDTLEAIAGLIASAILKTRVAVLEEADRLKAAFFANVSHEFRTPITLSLSPLEEILGGRCGPLPGAIADHLELVRRNQQRLLELINQILELARLESGDVRLRVTRMADVNRFVEERVRPFRAVAHMRGLDLRLSLDDRLLGAPLYLDREHFERLVSNLLSNALKFTDRGHVEVATELAGDGFVLRVTDTGTGIPADQVPYVFDRFRRAVTDQHPARGGTGIGLHLVKEVAVHHGGGVRVDSRLGQGSSFEVRIPLGTSALRAGSVLEVAEDEPGAVAADAAASVASAAVRDTTDVDEVNAAAEARFDPAKPVVLYVEDNRDMRAHVHALLTDDYNVFLAADGRDGLAKARAYRPEVIVTDQMMPDVSGGELLRAVREDPGLSSVPVLLLTALASTDARIESLDAGADDYLTKPFHREELRARVRNLVRSHSQERALAELNRQREAQLEQQMAELIRTGELKRFLPRPVVESLLGGGIDPAGGFERRKITVLFADMVGFTDLADTVEPEDLSFIVNEYLAEMSAVAVSYGGTVDNLMGDGLMVIFGAPDRAADDEHAWAATRAALAMLARADDLAAQARRRGVAGQLQVRVGLNTGYCTVGVFGSEFLRMYTAIGLPVNVAARLQAEAQPGTILCGSQTFGLVQDRVDASELRPFSLRGTARPTQACEIRGTVDKEASSPGDAAAPPSAANPGGAAADEVSPSVFRREGDLWTIAYDGAAFRLGPLRGLHYLGQLLAQPRREFHVLDLADAPEGMDLGIDRLRLEVSGAMTEAIAAIDENHPGLGQHLRATITMGTFCSYSPFPGSQATWVI